MDPFSQAVLGTMAALTCVKKKASASESTPSIKAIALWGALGGLAPDLDVLIRSATDPLFHVQYHRHFTHSLFFIPIGALIVSLFLKLFRVPVKRSYLYTFLGYATHGILDAFTNYGTQLFWPISSYRVALNNVAVVDPLCTLPLIFLVILAIKFRKLVLNYVAIGYFTFYMALGFYQNARVTNFLKDHGIINSTTKRYMVKPTIFNNVVWRAIIMDDDTARFYAVKSIPLGRIKLYPKVESAKIVKEEEIENLLKNYPSKNYRYDYERFKNFTSGYLHWGVDGSIVDSRYSILPYSSQAMWDIDFKNAKAHVNFNTSRVIDLNKRREFLKLLLSF